MLLDQGNLGAKSRRTGRRHQSSRPRTDDNEIISGRRGRVLPIGRVKIGNEAPVVSVRRRDQDRLGVGAHKLCGLPPVSALLIFFSNAFLATRVTNIVTPIVASSPTPYNTHSPVVRWRCPEPTLTREPRYTYITVPGIMPIQEASTY